MNMRGHTCSPSLPIILALVCFGAQLRATDWSTSYVDELLARVSADQRSVLVGDMEILVTNLRAWRRQLTGEPSAQSASDGNAPLWTNGKVYYSFDVSVALTKQQAFLDGAAEWAMFANLQFIARTTQANYMLVKETPGLNGGQSAVGMIGGEQIIQFGPTAWNRSTICHEIGHALGMVHEHQRFDRDSFVQIFTNNISGGALGNFIKLGNSSNLSAYDFLSVMHYNTNSFAINPGLPTIYPLPNHMQFAGVIGAKYDPVLSAADRAGMAARYGPGPALSPVVTSTADSGTGSLRAALYYAFDHPGTTITFNIPVNDPGFSNNVINILPSDRLPSLVHATTLNGSSQPTDNNPSGPEILLNGARIEPLGGYANGFKLTGTNCSVRGLIVIGFPGSAVLIEGSGAISNHVTGCYLGVNASGTETATNGLYLVQISNGAKGNTVGGPNAADRNVISGSRYQGLVIHDSGSDFNTVLGNFIGLNAAGTAALPNSWSGVAVFGGARSNRIGGATTATYNVISGNAQQGIALSDTGTSGNQIDGNYIGLNAAGTAAIPNGWSGVDIFGGASSNQVGGLTGGMRNVISGNGNNGVAISSTGSDRNTIYGNVIGLNAAGLTAVPNNWSGVALFGNTKSNRIGAAGFGNLISGNGNQGVSISGSDTTGNVVAGNSIGVNNAGAAAGNQWSGVVIYGGAKSNLIGGTLTSGRNLISGNGNQGVVLTSANTRGNVISGNYIGLNAAGTAALGNTWSGVGLYSDPGGGPDSNLIGGTAPGTGNVISGNGNQGIALADSSTRSNSVQGNLIGLNAAGNAAVPNGWSGVELSGAVANLIGGGVGARNFISGNANYGIALNSQASGNRIQGNTIGYNAAHSGTVPNSFAGVVLFLGAVSNQIGGITAGTANLIAGNMADGVQLFDAATTNNSVRGNSIFGNTGVAVGLYSSANRGLVAPSLSSAVLNTDTTVNGSHTGPASTSFQIDFYADAAPAGSAEGRTYLGSRTVITSGAGTVNFSATLGALVPAGRVITASATDPAGNTSRLSTGVAVTLTSSVNDQLPDSWRALYFGGAGTTTNAQSCSNCDPDGDGANNHTEFFTGTNPTNATSVLKLTALPPTGSGDVASFFASSGLAYRLSTRDNAASGTWTILADQVIGTGANLLVNDPHSLLLPTRLYRAEVLR